VPGESGGQLLKPCRLDRTGGFDDAGADVSGLAAEGGLDLRRQVLQYGAGRSGNCRLASV
jgi:hypothetical protein